MRTIRIEGVNNPSNFELYIDSNMVDIAYMDNIESNIVILLLENEIEPNNPDDRTWILSLINQALSECQEENAKVIF